MSGQRLTFISKPDGWVIDGELDGRNSASLRLWCEGIETVPERRTLELAGLEILDARGMAAAIEAVRWLLQRTPVLTLAHPPHLLAHTLYRIGMLAEGSRLGLFEPRQEEPFG